MDGDTEITKEELARLRSRRDGLSGVEHKTTRKKLNKKIREVEEKLSSAIAAPETGRATRGMSLDAAELPPFRPPVRHVRCAGGETETVLAWAFTCCVPPTLRTAIFASDNEAMAANYSPAVQWADSVYHIVQSYETMGLTKAKIEDASKTSLILLEITHLRACPDTHGAMGELKRENFIHAPNKSVSLGSIPIFFVRFLYLGKEALARRGGTDAVMSQTFARGERFSDTKAASAEEMEYGNKALQRGQRFLSGAKEPRSNDANDGDFSESLLFPPDVEYLQRSMKRLKAQKLCASCLCPAAKGEKLLQCARCKVTYYCGKECQRQHWKAGHKKLCRSVSESSTDTGASAARRSFVFDAASAEDPNLTNSNGMHTAALYQNHRTGQMTSSLGTQVGLAKVPTTRNVHGDNEFAVKLQPPNISGFGQPWMCYDGPTRSFQAFIPCDTPGLSEVQKLLKRDGIWMPTPFGVKGNKGYCMARWEGSKIRVFFDRLAPPQPW